MTSEIKADTVFRSGYYICTVLYHSVAIIIPILYKLSQAMLIGACGISRRPEIEGLSRKPKRMCVSAFPEILESEVVA